MIDYSKYKTASAEPEASSMIETFRAIGYSVEAAIADIIDNSVSAGAKNVWIDFEWKGENTTLSIKDDGCGMDNDELILAMRPGSKNPLEYRSEKDLGRFGLGLKTASFSQCRKFTVISKKKNNDIIYWTWDLDYVNQSKKWNLINFLPDNKHKEELDKQISGTIVIWQDIDRIVKSTNEYKKDDNEKFLELMKHVKTHLAMVFHRYIEQNKIKLWFAGSEIEPWDPYLRGENGLQIHPEENYYNGKIIVKGFVLPHKSKITEETYKYAEGPKGWNAQQGFYIYRNERLLVAGEWLGMFRQEEHYKLARIKVELTNELDEEWQIDIKKSVARPPAAIKQSLKAYANHIRSNAAKVYRFRGVNINPRSGQGYTAIWDNKTKHSKIFYEINREHPLLKSLLKELPAHESKISAMLKLIEHTVPVRTIFINECEKPDAESKPLEGENKTEIIRMIKIVYETLLLTHTQEEAKQQLYTLEPFNEFPQLIEEAVC